MSVSSLNFNQSSSVRPCLQHFKNLYTAVTPLQLKEARAKLAAMNAPAEKYIMAQGNLNFLDVNAVAAHVTTFGRAASGFSESANAVFREARLTRHDMRCHLTQ